MDQQRSLKCGLIAGLGAGAMMTLVMMVLRFTLDTISIPEILADLLIEITQGRVFSNLLGILQTLSLIHI